MLISGSRNTNALCLYLVNIVITAISEYVGVLELALIITIIGSIIWSNVEPYTRLWYRHHPAIRNLMKQFICRWAGVVTLIAFIQPIRKDLVDRTLGMNNHQMIVKCIHSGV